MTAGEALKRLRDEARSGLAYDEALDSIAAALESALREKDEKIAALETLLSKDGGRGKP